MEEMVRRKQWLALAIRTNQSRRAIRNLKKRKFVSGIGKNIRAFSKSGEAISTDASTVCKSDDPEAHLKLGVLLQQLLPEFFVRQLRLLQALIELADRRVPSYLQHRPQSRPGPLIYRPLWISA